MKRLFVLTPEAKNDLKEILLDIAEDSPDKEAKPIQVISVVHGARDLAVFFTLRVSH